MFPSICKTDQLVSVLRTDNGGEYEDTTFQSCLRKKGIHHETSAPRTLQHNGVAEGDNRTLSNQLELFCMQIVHSRWNYG
jgi:transposase InsO family protein